MSSFCINSSQIPKDIFVLSLAGSLASNMLKLDFGDLQTLQHLGLFLPNEMTEIIDFSQNNVFSINYFNEKIQFKSINDELSSFQVPGYFALSNSGKQILQHLNPQFNEEYFNWLKSNYKVPGLVLM
jgi:hypothetical protein